MNWGCLGLPRKGLGHFLCMFIFKISDYWYSTSNIFNQFGDYRFVFTIRGEMLGVAILNGPHAAKTSHLLETTKLCNPQINFIHTNKNVAYFLFRFLLFKA